MFLMNLALTVASNVTRVWLIISLRKFLKQFVRILRPTILQQILATFEIGFFKTTFKFKLAFQYD